MPPDDINENLSPRILKLGDRRPFFGPLSSRQHFSIVHGALGAFWVSPSGHFSDPDVNLSLSAEFDTYAFIYALPTASSESLLYLIYASLFAVGLRASVLALSRASGLQQNFSWPGSFCAVFGPAAFFLSFSLISLLSMRLPSCSNTNSSPGTTLPTKSS